jgi:hypothetical protein
VQHVGAQEMLHLALLPFGADALRHFMFLERPEGMDLEDARWPSAPCMSSTQTRSSLRLQDIATIGHLYRSIEFGITHPAEKYGEQRLFIVCASSGHRGLIPLTRADTSPPIRPQCCGPPILFWNKETGVTGARRISASSLRFSTSTSCCDRRAAFEQTRPVLTANVRHPERETTVPIIADPGTGRIVDLFNLAYESLLQIFSRFFAYTEETDYDLAYRSRAPRLYHGTEFRAVVRDRLLAATL